MSILQAFDLISAIWNGRKDAHASLPEGGEPPAYWEYLARKGHRQARIIERRFWEEDGRNKRRWIQAEAQAHVAALELKRLRLAAEQAEQAYEQERARDQEEAQALNPPGRAYVPVLLYWVLLALLIAGDAAISYAAFLSIGKVLFWQVAALSIMVVVSMVVIGHVIGDLFRHGRAGLGAKLLMFLVVIAISVVLTLFRENAQEAVRNASTAKLETITLTAPGQPATTAPGRETPSQSGAPTATTPGAVAPAQSQTQTDWRFSWNFSWDLVQIAGFLMFLLITAMGIAIPALLAYYVERRPRLLKVAQANLRAAWARFRYALGRARCYRAHQRAAQAKAHRLSRHLRAAARLNEARESIYYLMAAYADANMRKRSSQALPQSMRQRPPVPGAEILGELDWTNPEAQGGPAYGGLAFREV